MKLPQPGAFLDPSNWSPWEAAAARTRRGVVSPGRADTTIDKTLAELLIPQNAAEVAMYGLGGGMAGQAGRKLGAKGLAALMGLAGAGSYSDDAEAGPAGKVALKSREFMAELAKRLSDAGYHIFEPPNPNSLSRYLQVGKKSDIHEGVDPVGAVRVRAADHPGYGADFDFRPNSEGGTYGQNPDDVAARILSKLKSNGLGMAGTAGLGAMMGMGATDQAEAGPLNALRKAMKGVPMDEASRMARAAEQGYTIDAYKGMNPNIPETIPDTDFRGTPTPSTANRVPSPITEGQGNTFFSSRPDVASRFADALTLNPAVMPAKLKMNNPLVIDAQGKPAAAFQFDAIARDHGTGKEAKAFRDFMNGKGDHDGVVLRNTADEGDVFVPRHGEQIRSRFAAFDPANIGKPGLLGSGLGALMGLGATDQAQAMDTSRLPAANNLSIPSSGTPNVGPSPEQLQNYYDYRTSQPTQMAEPGSMADQLGLNDIIRQMMFSPRHLGTMP